MTNTNYGKLTDGKLTYASDFVQLDGFITINPTAEQYARAGWLRMAHNAPETREGFTARVSGYEARDGQIFAVYAYDPIVVPPRVFSKLRLLQALGRRNLVGVFLEWIANSGFEPMWLAAQDLSEGFEGFASIEAQVREALGVSSEEVENILAEAVAQ